MQLVMLLQALHLQLRLQVHLEAVVPVMRHWQWVHQVPVAHHSSLHPHLHLQAAQSVASAARQRCMHARQTGCSPGLLIPAHISIRLSGKVAEALSRIDICA